MFKVPEFKVSEQTLAQKYSQLPGVCELIEFVVPHWSPWLQTGTISPHLSSHSHLWIIMKCDRHRNPRLGEQMVGNCHAGVSPSTRSPHVKHLFTALLNMDTWKTDDRNKKSTAVYALWPRFSSFPVTMHQQLRYVDVCVLFVCLTAPN